MASSKSEPTISEETSQRICAHMNEDHAVSVFAMAKRSVKLGGYSISKAILKKVTMEGCQLQVMLCRGDACRVERPMYPFTPPLRDPSEVRSRLIAVHHEACRPVAWFTNPLAVFIVSGIVCLVGCNLYLGSAGMLQWIEADEYRKETIRQLFGGDERRLIGIVRVLFYITIIAHMVESTYAAYHSKMSLKFSKSTTFAWYVSVLIGGFVPLQEFLELLYIDRACKRAKQDKKKAS